MSWKNSKRDGLPQKDHEVLISVNGINCVARYNPEKEGFDAVNTMKFFSVKTDTIYWQEIVPPENL